jgi:hypothetical protein
MNLPQALSGLLGGVVGAILAQVFAYIRYVWNKRDEGRFAALSLALTLEAYASECTEPFFALSNYASSSGAWSAPTGTIPQLADYPQTNWRNLGMKHAITLLNYRVVTQSARSYVESVAETDGRQGAWTDAADKGLELGAEAMRIAKELRSSFKLPPADILNDFDIGEFFKRELANISAQKAKFATGQAELMASLETPRP